MSTTPAPPAPTAQMTVSLDATNIVAAIQTAIDASDSAIGTQLTNLATQVQLLVAGQKQLADMLTAVQVKLNALPSVTSTTQFGTAAVGGSSGTSASATDSVAATTPPPTTQSPTTQNPPLPYASGTFPFQVYDGVVPQVAPSATGNTYYVSPTGKDTNAGTQAAPFATPQKAADTASPGDVILIHAGKYYGGISCINGNSGTAAAPITFAPVGDGEVIIDGSVLPTGWLQVSAGVYSATSKKPMAVVIDGVPLRPVTGTQTVTQGSGLWSYASGKLTVDFGNTTPAAADLVLPGTGSGTVVYWYGINYLTFHGLTIRGSSEGGAWGYGNGVVLQYCKCVFNTKAGINFMSMSSSVSDGCQALYNMVDWNSMHNWPRGNNGFAASGGGWSGGLAFSGTVNGVARGNLVRNNGGEGLISYGSSSGQVTGASLFEHNVMVDNWSMNSYVDNQPNCIVRDNILWFTGYDTSTWLEQPSAGYPWNSLYKYAVGFALADEYNSSDNGSANLANTQVYNNLIVGHRLGIMDYAEGALTTPHGLKNTKILANTIITMASEPPGSYAAGLFLEACGTNNSGSEIAGNMCIGLGSVPAFWYAIDAAVTGITFHDNAYAGSITDGYNNPASQTLAQWQAASGVDKTSVSFAPTFTTPTPDKWAQLESLVMTGGTALPQVTMTMTGATRGARYGAL